MIINKYGKENIRERKNDKFKRKLLTDFINHGTFLFNIFYLNYFCERTVLLLLKKLYSGNVTPSVFHPG